MNDADLKLYAHLKSSLSRYILFKKNNNSKQDNTNDYLKSDEFIKYAKKIAHAHDMNINTEEFDNFLNEVIDDFLINMNEGESLINKEDMDHDFNWAKKKDWNEIDYYSKAYESFLTENSDMVPNVVETIMQNSLNILCSLGDPEKEGKWARKGLVFGHVQSGKTANFLGLISRAADTGYKMIIVLTTSHENLRQQTQIRIDEGFIGIDTGDLNKKPIGVGALNTNYKRPINLTTSAKKGDGNMQHYYQFQVTDIDRPWVVVTKKNVPLLKKLHAWLKEPAVNGKIKNMPILLIDDEADYASVNTKKPEVDPTNTNKWIRKILALYDRSSYLGVTATPFANIFINHETRDEMLEDDLFPKDLIYNLEAPENYFGANKIFTDPDSSNKIVECIYDGDNYFPTKKDKISIDGIPDSLINAFHEFIIAKSIRNLRGHNAKHCTMMINAHTHKVMTISIFHNMKSYHQTVMGAITSNYMMDDNFATKNSIMSKLRSTFDDVFRENVEEKWDDIKRELNNAIKEMKFYAEYSGSPYGGLDYTSWTKDGKGLTAVVVGGFKLSRGLTLEGLTVSYLYRDPQVGDTLLQLGRFFGYRANYDDLVRVHMKEDTRRHFGEISDSIENLRSQITQMIEEKFSPEQFGLYMYSNFSDKFRISSPSKMRSAKDIEIRIGYAGEIIYNDHISSVAKDIKNNEEKISNFFDNYKSKIKNSTGADASKYLKDIDTKSIINLLSSIDYPESNKSKFNNLLQYLEEKIHLHPLCDVIFDCTTGDEEVSNFPFNFGFRKRLIWRYDEDGKYWVNKNSQLTDKTAIRRVIEPKQQEILDKKYSPKEMSNRLYQTIIKKPVLLIAPINAIQDEGAQNDKLYGTELYYPTSIGREDTIKVKANTVYGDQYEFYWPEDDIDD